LLFYFVHFICAPFLLQKIKPFTGEKGQQLMIGGQQINCYDWTALELFISPMEAKRNLPCPITIQVAGNLCPPLFFVHTQLLERIKSAFLGYVSILFPLQDLH
jgi:hypothetical protein